MANPILQICGVSVPYNPDECLDEGARIYHVGFVRCDVATFDPSVLNNWQTVVGNGTGIFIPDVRGSYSASPTQDAGYGASPSRLTGITHTVTWVDYKYKENCEFYNRLRHLSRLYRFYFFTQTLVHTVANGVSAMAIPVISDNISDNVKYQATVTWSNINLPCHAPSPFRTICEYPLNYGGGG